MTQYMTVSVRNVYVVEVPEGMENEYFWDVIEKYDEIHGSNLFNLLESDCLIDIYDQYPLLNRKCPLRTIDENPYYRTEE